MIISLSIERFLATAITKLLSNTYCSSWQISGLFYILLRASWASLFYICHLLDPFINWTSSSVSS